MNGDQAIEEKEILKNEVIGMKGWLKFIGILTIIGGILYALSLIGIVVAWIPIWLGVLLLQAGNAADEFGKTGTTEDLRRHLAKVRMYFTIVGVLAIILMIFFVVLFILFIIALIAGSSLFDYFSNW